jgi:hypothetical protein
MRLVQDEERLATLAELERARIALLQSLASLPFVIDTPTLEARKANLEVIPVRQKHHKDGKTHRFLVPTFLIQMPIVAIQPSPYVLLTPHACPTGPPAAGGPGHRPLLAPTALHRSLTGSAARELAVSGRGKPRDRRSLSAKVRAGPALTRPSPSRCWREDGPARDARDPRRRERPIRTHATRAKARLARTYG